MNKMRMLHSMTARLAAGILLMAGAAAAAAADWPTRTVTLVVSYPPGGTVDAVARIIAPRLGEKLGQTVVVDNRGGAGGMIGGAAVARAKPDGYTFLLDASNHTQNPALRSNMQFDTLADLDAVSLLLRVPTVVVVTPSYDEVQSVQDLVKLGRERDDIHYASSGPGSSTHLATELFNLSAGTRLIHVPYKGGGPAMVDVMSGQVPLMFASLGSSIPHIKSGKMRPIALGGRTRSSALPDISTLAESGIEGFEAYEWNAVFAPSGTSKAIVDRFSQVLADVLKDPEVIKTLSGLGAEIIGSTPEELEQFRRDDIRKWSEVAKKANISLE
ncbi:tripartite-type tricarboxylate transporter receptor subunit TctC [Paracandidimonas soli]|uniref:Tripartite-type tricarboxylate transporter receptor subunit TctC n=2 Tax=Paracandidimonas soli TaxID=1917182 RepID=A0A4R3V694_9BURK|nr:tripartite-type tricarboxylate transporter receptor subunit TctC [Paracandidimonas soli]